MSAGTGRPRKRRRLVLQPKIIVQPCDSDASTIPMNITGDSMQVNVGDNEEGVSWRHDTQDTANTVDNEEVEGPAEVHSDSDSLASESDEETGYNEEAPLRNDMDIVRGRWHPDEVDALMIALNVNRDAIKFHFEGPGGGKDVKRQGWKDVAMYVNDVAGTHRTVKACRKKGSDYSQRSKAKYNKLRYEVSQTGRGKIKKKFQLKGTESVALDYLREEAVKGIPGIEAMDLGGPKMKKPSRKNKALLWDPDRQSRPKYEEVNMERQGVPKNYTEKNKRRMAREERQKKKKEEELFQKSERKKEKVAAKKAKKEIKLNKLGKDGNTGHNENEPRKSDDVKKRRKLEREERRGRKKELNEEKRKMKQERSEKRARKRELNEEKRKRKQERAEKREKGLPQKKEKRKRTDK